MPIVFRDLFVRALPADPSPVNTSRQVHGAAFTRVLPTPVSAPRLIAWSSEVAESLGLPLGIESDSEFIAALAGNRVLGGMAPYAACYGGHQFGHWAGQLGDGRAITLGELETGQSSVGSPVHLELQLKGAGPTPYSRGSDGRAVLRSSVREFLCSEAMHHLGVPTTRALSLVATGDRVVRDVLYNGNAAPEPGAIVARVAPTFLRFGNFELPTSRRDETLLRAITDFTIRTHFPDLSPHLGNEDGSVYALLLGEVARRTAVMVAHWMRVGFVHGVMNTDNMSILGLTIDYGPYGWIEPFDPGWTPNTTDAGRKRYRFGQQPAVAAWNVACLAEALAPLVRDPSLLAHALSEFDRTFEEEYRAMTAAKLGLLELRPDGENGDGALVLDLFAVLASVEIDMTLFFRTLSEVDLAADPSASPELALFGECFYDWNGRGESGERLAQWIKRWSARVREDGRSDDVRKSGMRRANPRYVLRNWLAQEAIDRTTAGDTGAVSQLLDVLRRPYDDQPGKEAYAKKRPEWARHRVGCSMLSCSS